MSYSYKEQEIIDYLARGQEYQRYIFNNLADFTHFQLIYENEYFSSAYNPKPVESGDNKGFYTIPHWPALTYLERVSKDCLKLENQDYAKKIMSIIRENTRPKGNKKADNWRTWQSFVKILSNMPSEVVNEEDVNLIQDWLESNFDNSMVVLEIGETLLPKLINHSDAEKKIGKLIKIIIESIKIERRHGMQSHSLQELFKINARQLGEKYGSDIIKLLKVKLENIISEKDDKYSYIWRPAIEDSEQNIAIDEYRHILISGLRDIFLAYASSNEATEHIRLFFSSSKYIIRRFSLYITNQLFSKYGKIAEEIINTGGNPIFAGSNYHHELYTLITKRFISFSIDVRSSLIDIITSLNGGWKDDSDKDRFNCMLRRRWLYAIKQSGYKISNELEDKYFKDIAYKPDHPEFLSYIGPVSWGDESLFSSAELLSKGGADEIIAFLNNFEGKNRFRETAIREAGQSLKEAIKNKQELFENHLLKFKKLKYEYWYYVLQAFEEIVRDKKPINWEKVLGFCNEIILSEILWDGIEKNSDYPIEPKKDWIPAVVSDLLKKGLQEDSIIFTETQYVLIDKIVRVLVDKQSSTASGDDKNALTEAINTTKGYVLECFKSYVLRRYRDFERLPDKGTKEKESFWKTVEPLFDNEVKQTERGNFEFSSIAGAYLPNLYYLNKDWLVNNINKIFSADDKHWRCAMQGYSYVSTVYEVIYDLLKNNGHLKRALDIEFLSEQTRKRVVENISMSYIRNKETIDDNASLFDHILKQWHKDDLEDIISLFWSHRDAELDCEQKGRIFDFWRYCFVHIKGHEDEHKEILSDLNLLAVFFDKLEGEQKEWLRQSILHVEDRYHSAFLLEYLDKLADASPEEVGQVFILMLKKNTPSYKQENIRSIVEKLFKAGLKNDSANDICDKYARKGFDFLTEIYNRYR